MWVARDPDGDLYLFDNEPEMECGVFTIMGIGGYMILPSEFCPTLKPGQKAEVKDIITGEHKV